ncbi:hypothetical protein C0585_08400, partial [Candidatus Woesearchaeota archaeon]
MAKELDLNLPKSRKYITNTSLWKRCFSFMIDFLVLDFFVIGSFSITMSNLFPDMNVMSMFDFLSKNPDVASQANLILLMIGILNFSYMYYFQKNLGQTIGMKIMNLYIGSDKEIQYWQYILRNLYIIPALPFIFIPLID